VSLIFLELFQGPLYAQRDRPLHIVSCGLKLDNEAVRVAVGLRLGLNLCVAHCLLCTASPEVTQLWIAILQRTSKVLTFLHRRC